MVRHRTRVRSRVWLVAAASKPVALPPRWFDGAGAGDQQPPPPPHRCRLTADVRHRARETDESIQRRSPLDTSTTKRETHHVTGGSTAGAAVTLCLIERAVVAAGHVRKNIRGGNNVLGVFVLVTNAGHIFSIHDVHHTFACYDDATNARKDILFQGGDFFC